MRAGDDLIRMQRLAVPLYSPASVTVGGDPAALDWTPLYAGDGARHVKEILPATTIVRELAAGFIGRSSCD
jgi:hypothetical protein